MNIAGAWNSRGCASLCVASIALSSVVGCVLREEKIQISRDGRVTIALEISGEVKELTQGDAMPSEESGWKVDRKTKIEDGKEELTLMSERTFAPGEDLPRTFASPEDPAADLYLDFPTSVETERRADGLYFIFRRVYSQRPWAYMQHWKDICFDEDIKKLGEKPVEELTREDVRTIAEASICDEAFAQAEWARVALKETLPAISVESGLIARLALIDFYKTDRPQSDDGQGNRIEQTDDYLDRIITRCADLQEDDRNACYDEEASRILANGLDAYRQTLQSQAQLSAAEIAQFDAAYAYAKRYYENTEAIGGHMFHVAVTLPGEIVAHNGDETTADRKRGVSEVSWEFKGGVLRDRPHELIAISKLTWDQVNRNEVDARDR